MTQVISETQFEAWLDRYGAAWEARDGDAFVALFDEKDLRYYWSPFTAPKKSHSDLLAAFKEATATQQRIHFGFQILALRDDRGIAHWRCRFAREGREKMVTIDGILSAEFNDDRCHIFREWWHSDEHDASDK